MLTNQKETQKKNEPKGVTLQKYNLNINCMREEKQQDPQNLNEASTTISEETKKNEMKLKIEENHENSKKIEVIQNNEDKKIQKQVENPSLPLNNAYSLNYNQMNKFIELKIIEIQCNLIFQGAYNSLLDPKNVNHNLLLYLNPKNYFNLQNQMFPYNYNISSNVINNFSNNINPLYNNSYFNNPFINNLSNGNFINNNINNPEKYTITLKSKTNDPKIEKISKITVTTSYIDNSSSKQNNKETAKKLINISDIISGKEKRTVVRLNPIPKKFLILDIIKLLDSHLKRERNKRIYKALYVPYTKGKEKNLGYCFIMMASPKHVIDIYNAFNGKVFGKKKNPNPSKVIWADKQGDEFLRLNDDDVSRKPLIFNDCCV